MSSETRVGSREIDLRLARLMEGYQRGEAVAFEKLYSLVAPELRRYLTYLCRDADLAEDLTQDCFLQIHRVRHTFLPTRPFRPWAFAIARNVYLMDRRSLTRRRKHEFKFPLSDSTLPQEIDRLARREDTFRVLSGLSEKHREALILHHAFGFSFAEIGALTGTRAGTAKTRSHRALKQLREELRRGHQMGDVHV